MISLHAELLDHEALAACGFRTIPEGERAAEKSELSGLTVKQKRTHETNPTESSEIKLGISDIFPTCSFL